MNKQLSRRSFLKIGIGSFCVGSCGGYGFAFEPTWVEVNKFDVIIPGLPAQFNGFSLVHISDIHHGAFVRLNYIEKCLKMVLELKPEIVVITGDFVYGHPKYARAVAAKLKLISDKIPTYTVLGNHDYWTDSQIVKEELTKAKIYVFKNGNVPLERKKAQIWLMGMDDLWTGNPDLKQALEGTKPDEVKILITHQPDTIEMIKGEVNLILCGHTHGGQVTLPLIGPPLVPSKFGAKYAKGLFKIGNMQMYVNKGIGLIPPPVRFLTRPEIAYITLKSNL